MNLNQRDIFILKMAGRYPSSSNSSTKHDSDSDEDISVNEKCVYCQKEDIKFITNPCRHKGACKKCAMRLATGGKCKTCKRHNPFCQQNCYILGLLCMQNSCFCALT